VKSLLKIIVVGVVLGIATSIAGAEDRFQKLFSGKAKLLDLTYPINKDNAYWPGGSYFPFTFKNLATYDKDGVYSNSFSMPEHLGTHMDAPNHFVKGQSSLDQIPLTQLFGPAVVVDTRQKVNNSPDYQLNIQDIKEWEKAYGPIPAGAIILMHTGWGKRWSDFSSYQNRDAQGNLHFPGYSPEVAQFLIKERDIYGIGIDTLSVDYGLSKGFKVHHICHGAGKYHLENVANLDKMPNEGAYLILAPIKIQGGSGGPTRIYAVLP
jgi:kynurenine formamidase